MANQHTWRQVPYHYNVSPKKHPKTKRVKGVKKPPPASMGVDELRAQIAVGALKDPKAIAAVIKVCEDPDVLQWASRHKRASVRVAAASKRGLPFGKLFRLIFLDRAKTVKTAAAHTVGKYYFNELLQLLNHIEEYPQLSLPFPTATRPADPDTEDHPSTFDGDKVADALQIARKSHVRGQDIPVYEEWREVDDEEEYVPF